jgi:hypothetical protein
MTNELQGWLLNFENGVWTLPMFANGTGKNTHWLLNFANSVGMPSNFVVEFCCQTSPFTTCKHVFSTQHDTCLIIGLKHLFMAWLQPDWWFLYFYFAWPETQLISTVTTLKFWGWMKWGLVLYCASMHGFCNETLRVQQMLSHVMPCLAKHHCSNLSAILSIHVSWPLQSWKSLTV